MSQSPDDSTDTGAHTDFSSEMGYGDYLGLDQILSAQHPRSDHHDEMLFIVIHQATELWMKLTLHEMGAAMACIAADNLAPASKMLARVTRIQSQLIQSWDVLSTLTPADYLAFRDVLGHASGFQSHQYRLLEFLLGNKNAAMLKPHAHDEKTHGLLTHALQNPCLYDLVIILLGKRGFEIDPECLARDWSETYAANPSVLAAWTTVYADTQTYWDLYQLAEDLIDLEDWFQQWRFRHLTTVERIIGNKRGTGGTLGVDYLKRALDGRFFPELWQVRTGL